MAGFKRESRDDRAAVRERRVKSDRRHLALRARILHHHMIQPEITVRACGVGALDDPRHGGVIRVAQRSFALVQRGIPTAELVAEAQLRDGI